MKKGFIVAGVVLAVIALVILPPLAWDIHLLLARQSGLTWNPLEGWRGILQGGNPLKFYGLLLAAVALGLLWAVVSSVYIRYKSDMVKVTPDIYTPAPAGQGQYGTAQWMPRKKIGEFFGVVRIGKSEMLQDLLNAGKQDYEEVKEWKEPR